MPHRRTIKKGSFGSRLDELVKILDPEPRPSQEEPGSRPKPKADEVHDSLFESSWHPARNSDGRSTHDL